MRVTVEASVFIDPRFDVLAAELQCSRDSALVRMMRIWLQCTERERDRFPARLMGHLLQCEPARAARALCRAELGERAGRGQIRIRGCAGERIRIRDIRSL